MNMIKHQGQDFSKQNMVQENKVPLDFTSDIVPIDHLILNSLDQRKLKTFKSFSKEIKKAIKFQENKQILDEAANYILNNENINQGFSEWEYIVKKHNNLQIISPQVLFSLIIRFPEPVIIKQLVEKSISIPVDVNNNTETTEYSNHFNMIIIKENTNNTNKQSTKLHELKPYVFYLNKFTEYFENKTDNELLLDFENERYISLCMFHFLITNVKLTDLLLAKKETDKQVKLTHLNSLFIEYRKNYNNIENRFEKLFDKYLKTETLSKSKQITTNG